MKSLMESDMHSYEIFAERFHKVQFRNFTNNTRLDVKGTNWSQN